MSRYLGLKATVIRGYFHDESSANVGSLPYKKYQAPTQAAWSCLQILRLLAVSIWSRAKQWRIHYLFRAMTAAIQSPQRAARLECP